MKLFIGVLAISVILFSLLSPIYNNYGKTNEGTIRLYGAYFNDSINNIALIKGLKTSVPPENMNYSGTKMASYHYFINLIMAKASQLFNIDDFTMYFKIAPLLLISLLAYFSWNLATKLGGSHFVGAMGTLFVLVSGNMYYFTAGKPSVAWIDEFSSKLINYQYLSSLLIMFGLFFILSLYKKLTLKVEITVALITALLFGFKFYAGVLFLSSLLFVPKFRRIFFLSIIPTLCVLFFLKGGSETVFPFEFKPFWVIKSMFESPDRLNYPTWELARQTLLSTKSYLGISKLYLIGVVIYLLVNFGPRLISLLKKSENDVESLIKIISILGIIIPLLFVQRESAVWNIVQFSYYSVACMGFLLALQINKLKGGIKPMAFSILWLSLIPGVLYTVNDYANPGYTATLSVQFLEASDFLGSSPAGSVIVHPKISSNAIVSAISGHPAYLGDSLMLNSYGINSSEREKIRDDFFADTSISLPDSIKYIFVPTSLKMQNVNFKNIYNNSEISIYSQKP
jgi:hypothetical protein